MTALLAFLRFAWPYMLCTGIGFGVGGYLEKNHWEARYSELQASTEQRLADAQAAATQALQKQIQTRLDTEAHNGQVIAQLQADRDSAVSDAQFARRLLAAAQAGPAASHPMPIPASGPRFDDATGPSGDRSLAQDLGDAAGECRNAIQRLAALQAELGPQLTR